MKKTILIALLIALSIALALTFTTCEEPHTHEWGAWQSNAEQHWKECSCGEKTDIGNHDYDTDFVCTVCGYYILQNWTAVANSTFGSNDIDAIAYGNNRFVAGSVFGMVAYSADGSSWTRVSDSKISQINDIAYGNNRFVAVGCSYSRPTYTGIMAYSANGESWTAVADSTFGTSTNDLIYGIAYGIADGASVGRFVAVGLDGKMAYADW